ncbi:gamma-glutamyl:cysteine ligase YbdK (ATP-grasp superfamily) [Herbihabitans rhizosphaerae]|uniref:Gamma-glutamyl:cysteine ligase YbdK (ATP-grasp superfamily) n=1 Tax=Herbihabitans rhizosphaerae TaxID=1872711 RepID=A0A4Q7KCE4_9PSEU|nr:glutamate-cysteine ligase family protein [Herbihabitans rhizosphaerae]RZS30373.1 gamma-glutamyl:cysteine ligase YbdK (ATP-grasp superfamily) [Herbihabitans rhizosphaerae]
MGKDVQATVFTRADRQRFRQKVRTCLDVFAQMLAEARFDADRPMAGLEIELNLVDGQGDPAMRNARVLDAISDPAFQTELGQFNIEINIPPQRLDPSGLAAFEDGVRASLNVAERHAAEVGAHIVMIGILPTLRRRHMHAETLSANPRYALLNEQIFAARGEDLEIDIRGVERLLTQADTIAPESACTSVQYHLQVAPENFARFWNASQAIAGIQVALGANAPYLFGKQLWPETRIALFEQATDTRPDELKAQGVRPRVWFGDRWITSIFDLFEENVRYFSALLPLIEDEDPAAVLARGDTPELGELRLHNGTIYRWNRPIYDVVKGRPHLRVENRVLPAGPTVVDVLANGALYFGLVRALADEDRPLWTQMSFSAAEENFHAGARAGLDARVYWPGVGEVGVAELVLRRLLPLAHTGLERWGVSAEDRDRLLGIIEQRCITGRNGAVWQTRVVHDIEETTSADRPAALRQMTQRYAELMHTNEPVHTWPM